MLKHLEKYTWVISLVLFGGLLVALFLSPGAGRGLSLAAIGVSLAMAVGLTIQKRVKMLRQGGISRQKMVTSLLVDVTGLLLTMGAGWLLARLVGVWAAQAAWERTSLTWAALLAGLGIGLAAGALVRLVWQKVIFRLHDRRNL